MKIAIIEDDEDFATIVDLKFPDGEFTHFKEVDEFEDKGYDAVITDLRLKKSWGQETIHQLRKKTTAPIIVLTGLGGHFLSAKDMQIFLEAGATEAFQKDIITNARFPDIIKEIVGNHHGA